MSVESAKQATPEVMEDGTILAGYYKGKPLYATPKPAPGRYSFNGAASYAQNFDAHGHHDFRVPNKGELKVLFKKCADIGVFNDDDLDTIFWSSSPFLLSRDTAWTRSLKNGSQDFELKFGSRSLWLVRG